VVNIAGAADLVLVGIESGDWLRGGSASCGGWIPRVSGMPLGFRKADLA
jgi:hypothetical protein